jgi:hypothetical protein
LSLDDILQNERYWEVYFNGFRFPYTNPGCWGLMALHERDYMFVSSIGANNLDFIHGSVMPHNIVFSTDGFFIGTDMLEIAPTYHDDYYFLKDMHGNLTLSKAEINKRVMIHSKYLENFWDYSVKPYKGVMVYLGHPLYTGYNDTTLTSLLNLVARVKADNSWITNINEVAVFRKNLADLHFFVEKGDGVRHISVVAENDAEVKNASLNLVGKARSASARRGTVKIKEKADGSLLIFDAFDGQVISVYF